MSQTLIEDDAVEIQWNLDNSNLYKSNSLV